MPDDIRDYRQLFLDDTPLLDVRAPVEFGKGAFPGAINLPLLEDDERHRIGICYAREGQDAAIALGHRLVSGSVREARLHAWLGWFQRHPEGVLYCFRGGLRSRTVQQWLAQAGCERPLVVGGYKAMRRFLLQSFERDIQRQPLRLLCGRTGTGKTRVIEAVPDSIDLEGLAHHRGSAFGRRPGGQPAQIDFENALAIALLRHRADGEHPLLLEDESRLIGRCYLPPVLQARMKQAPRVVVEESLDSRVQVTLEDYVLAPLAEFRAVYGEEQAAQRLGASLLDSLDRIRKRLGGARHAALRVILEDALEQQRDSGEVARHRDWILPLLRDYYDPMYDYMLDHHTGPVCFRGSRQAVQAWLADTA